MEPTQLGQEEQRHEISHRRRPSKREDSLARAASSMALKNQVNQLILPVARITMQLAAVEIQMPTILLEVKLASPKTTMRY